MLSAALIGLAIGGVFALIFVAAVRLGIERMNQGLLSSAGLLALVACCLWADGWVLAGVLGFVLGLGLLLRIQESRR